MLVAIVVIIIFFCSMENLKTEINKLYKVIEKLESKANNLHKKEKKLKNNNLKEEFLLVRRKVLNLIQDLDKL
tara:strand:- start:958 stop:1176 length:219 start_codon:yes stop_codon:yes gene_type:complete